MVPSNRAECAFGLAWPVPSSPARVPRLLVMGERAWRPVSASRVRVGCRGMGLWVSAGVVLMSDNHPRSVVGFSSASNAAPVILAFSLCNNSFCAKRPFSPLAFFAAYICHFFSADQPTILLAEASPANFICYHPHLNDRRLSKVRRNSNPRGDFIVFVTLKKN